MFPDSPALRDNKVKIFSPPSPSHERVSTARHQERSDLALLEGHDITRCELRCQRGQQMTSVSKGVKLNHRN